LFRPRIYNRERLHIQNGAIFVCNHVSIIDAVLLAVVSKRVIHFMAKSELFQSKAGNLFFRGLFAFPVHRDKTDLVSVKKAMQVLKAGRVFGIFPEGKRTITSTMDELEKGAAFLAAQSGAPIVPMFVARDSYEKRRVILAVGEPIDPASLKGECPKPQIIGLLTDKIQTALFALKNQVEEAHP
jgi:1-acyl-sn-glycerol-3-phosphate acyltransferase